MFEDGEARARNVALVRKHGPLPSYAYWSGEDVERESVRRRISWWRSLTTDADDRTSREASVWIVLLEQLVASRQASRHAHISCKM